MRKHHIQFLFVSIIKNDVERRCCFQVDKIKLNKEGKKIHSYYNKGIITN